MKLTVTKLLFIIAFLNLNAQKKLPEFNDKPAYYNENESTLIELEKSQYNIMSKAKGVFKAEGGFFLNGATSPVKIGKKEVLKFIVKVLPGTDPTSVLDLIQFEIRKDQRIFITVKAKALSNTNSFEKINYTVEKIKDGYYYLIAKELDTGEYFFGSSDFMFAFSIE